METHSNVYRSIDLKQIHQNRKGKVKSNFAERVFWEGIGWGFGHVEGNGNGTVSFSLFTFSCRFRNISNDAINQQGGVLSRRMEYGVWDIPHLSERDVW